ncbi:MAG: ArsR family transcriptional regulator [Actinomycetota bacterium]|nr:ArsR family transcriptional regulator [Actinomycetota bacterium]
MTELADIVAEIAAEFGVSRPTIYRHLQARATGNLVSDRH